MRSLLTDDGDQLAHGFAFLGVEEPPARPRFHLGHARIAPAARAPEVYGPVDAQRMQCRGELADSVAAELVRAINGQLGPPIADNLAFLAQRAGDHADLCPTSGVVRDRGAVGKALVVRMRMNEQHSRSLRHLCTVPGAV